MEAGALAWIYHTLQILLSIQDHVPLTEMFLIFIADAFSALVNITLYRHT